MKAPLCEDTSIDQYLLAEARVETEQRQGRPRARAEATTVPREAKAGAAALAGEMIMQAAREKASMGGSRPRACGKGSNLGRRRRRKEQLHN